MSYDSASTGSPATSEQIRYAAGDFSYLIFANWPGLLELRDNAQLNSTERLYSFRLTAENRSSKAWRAENAHMHRPERSHKFAWLNQAERDFETDLSFWRTGVTLFKSGFRSQASKDTPKDALARLVVGSYLDRFGADFPENDRRGWAHSILQDAAVNQAFSEPFLIHQTPTGQGLAPSLIPAWHADYEKQDGAKSVDSSLLQTVPGLQSTSTTTPVPTNASTSKPGGMPGGARPPPWFVYPDKSEPRPANKQKKG